MVTRIVDGNNANRLMLLEAEDGGELVTARNSAQGLAIEDGSVTRSFVTAEVSEGVPTGNFS